MEVDNEKIRQTGFDWQQLLDQTQFQVSSLNDWQKRSEELDYNDEAQNDREIRLELESRRLDGRVNVPTIGSLLKIVQETNVGTVSNAPRIVTTNNKTGKIMDGQRIKYVSRLANYASIYETEELSTGLSLEVTPSIGASGYLKLDVIAKLTTLGEIIANSPSESGQIIENTVIVKDKETFLLGAFQQTEVRKIKRKVPLIGYVLPFLFSRDVNMEVTKDILIILTPEIIDLEPVQIPEIQGRQ